MTGLRLGKKPASYDRRDLVYSDFRAEGPGGTYRPVPVGFGLARSAKVTWKMLGNGPADDNSLPENWTAARGGAGDCTCADSGHRVIYANALAGKTVDVDAKNAIDFYTAVTGYDPVTGTNDDGADMRTVLNRCLNVGFPDAAGALHKIGGYCALQAGDWTQLLEALGVFDVVAIGIRFPASAMDQFNAGRPWTYVAGSPVEGGHDVLVVNRPGVNVVDVVTWAKLQAMSERFYAELCDEAFGVFLPESLVDGKSPEGFDLAAFKAALAAL